MSMDTNVKGFVPPDENWRKMKAIWDACTDAGIPVPKEAEAFFGGEVPDPAGVEIDLPVRKWSDDGSAGYELDVDAIPPQVKVIRFYNSW